MKTLSQSIFGIRRVNMLSQLKQLPTVVQTEKFPLKQTRRQPCEHWKKFPIKNDYLEAGAGSDRDDFCCYCLKEKNYKAKHPAPNTIATSPTPNLNYQHDQYIHSYLSKEFLSPQGQ